MKKHEELVTLPKWAVVSVPLVLIVVIGYGAYAYARLGNEKEAQQNKFETRISDLENTLAFAQNALSETENAKGVLEDKLRTEEERVNSTKEIIDEITGTVNTLEKLSKLDPELLQKYSKVYFLNEHYEPEKLVEIPKGNLYYEEDTEEIHTRVWPFLEDLLDEADGDDVELYVLSGYRSFGTQSRLKSGYVFTYGAGTANQFSAEQGFSEHQLGTTADFMTTGIGGTLDGFEGTKAYRWLVDNAYKHGFTLSYPQGNSYYQFEPWHWRFVGTELARDLHRDKVYFYDVSQREIDQYLVDIFD